MSEHEPESTDKSNEIEVTIDNTLHQCKIPQDIRYSTEQDDRDKLAKKYDNYQVSDLNFCIIRFLLDRRQKKKLSNLQTFDVNLSPKYQTSSKFSFQLVGAEANVRTYLIDILNCVFKQPNQSSIQKNSEVDDQSKSTVTHSNEDKINTKVENSEEPYKFIPLEIEPEHKFILLITNQGQEVLKKNWSSFTGSLQQRLNITVANPFRLPKFGDTQSQYELSITGHVNENLIDAALQITAFINDILGVPIQLYKSRQNSSIDKDQFEQTKSNGIYEQIILIRRDCVARIVGTRGSTMKRIQSKCQLRDLYIARHADENDYIKCKISGYQVQNLNLAIDTIKHYLQNENQQAIQVFNSYYVDLSAYQTNQIQEPSSDLHDTMQQTGFLTIPSNFNCDNQFVQPSYNFQSTPTFDFTHQPTCASRENDKRSGDTRLSNENSENLNDSFSSSSSNSCSVLSNHQSKRTCPVTKEIDCSTDDGFWIQKQYYYALDDQSKQLFDELMKKFEDIRLANEENAIRKQQRLIGRNRTNKLRVSLSTTTTNDSIKTIEQEKVDESTND